MGESFADIFSNNKNTNTTGDGETSSLVKEYAMLLTKNGAREYYKQKVEKD
jgi:hypothetical protein